VHPLAGVLSAYGMGLALLPFVVWGPVYWRRCEPELGWRRARRASPR
jgi:hypothetical protein